jgi:hypothetical protein
MNKFANLGRLWISLATILAMLLALSPLTSLASQDNQQSQQDQQQQGESQQQSDQKPKKKGGFFGGLKKVTGGESGQESAATASAGSKAVGEGAKIGEITPTAADREQVTKMENYSIPQGDLKKFQENGHLKPKQ